jgi:hypothetical protein
MPPRIGGGEPLALAAEKAEEAAWEGAAGEAAVAKSAKSTETISWSFESIRFETSHTVHLSRSRRQDLLAASEETFDNIRHLDRLSMASRKELR